MEHIGTAAEFHPTTVTRTRELPGRFGTKPFLFEVERLRKNVLLLPRLKSDKIETLVQELRSTGLGTTEEVYKVLIPPLSHFDKLPNEAVADWRNESRTVQEEGIHCLGTYISCIGLLEAIQFREVQDRFAERAAAIVVGFLIRLVDEPIYQESGQSEEYIGNLRRLINKTGNKTVFKVFSLLGPILSRQGNDFVLKVLQLESAPSAPALEVNDFTFPNNADVFGWTENYWAIFKKRFSSRQIGFHVFDLAGQSVLHYLIDRTVGYRDNDYGVGQLATSIYSSFENHESFTALRNRQTPLHRAARAGHPQIIDMLLARGVDPDAADYFGRTGLCLAVYYGHFPVVNQLCDKMSLGGLNRTDVTKHNALHYAVLKFGKGKRFWKAKENAGSVQRNAAILEEQENAALALIQHGIHCNARDGVDATPLWYAASGDMKRVIEVLRKMDLVDLVNLKQRCLVNLKQGRRVCFNATEAFLLTPEQEAERAGHSEIATILKEWRLEKEQRLKEERKVEKKRKATEGRDIRIYFKPSQES